MKRAALLATILGSAAMVRAQRAEAALNLNALTLATGCWADTQHSQACAAGSTSSRSSVSTAPNLTPALKQLYVNYPRTKLEIVAVHTPEVPSYQKSLRYLAREMKRPRCRGRSQSTTSIAFGTRTPSRHGQRSSSSIALVSSSTRSSAIAKIARSRRPAVLGSGRLALVRETRYEDIKIISRGARIGEEEQ
jgi:hypothetical protein